MTRTLLVLALILTSTAACGTGPSKVARAVCPQIIEYSPDEQARAAEELKRLPMSGVVRAKFMPDYGRMRAEVRACRGS